MKADMAKRARQNKAPKFEIVMGEGQTVDSEFVDSPVKKSSEVKATKSPQNLDVPIKSNSRRGSARKEWEDETDDKPTTRDGSDDDEDREDDFDSDDDDLSDDFTPASVQESTEAEGLIRAEFE